MATVHVERDFPVPVETLYAHLSEHENLAPLFAPARVERVRDGDTERNGVGSVRRLSFAGLLPFEETVTAAHENERIEYGITKGSPLRHHYGVMKFSPTDTGGSHLDYTITLEAPIPGMASAIAATLTRTINGGLRRVEAEI